MCGGLLIWLAVTTNLTTAPQPATDAQPDSPQRLVVATRDVPPFAIRADGQWSGLSIDLLREVIKDLSDQGVVPEVEFRELALKPMLDAVERGEVDLAVAALTVNLQREARMDFSHPFHSSGLGIAVPHQSGSGWGAVVDRLFSWNMLKVVGGLALALFVLSCLLIACERRRNPEQFGGSYLESLGSALWWSIVTMTTVGYGDKAPRSLCGRLLAVVWMLAGLLFISSFTAAVTTTLTVGQLGSRIQGPDDLHKVRVASVASSTSEEFLRNQHIAHQAFRDIRQALEAAAEGRFDAVVYDAPILKHQVFERFAGRLRMLPLNFARQHYAIAMPSGYPHRETINRAILRVTADPTWEFTLRKYLGQP